MRTIQFLFLAGFILLLATDAVAQSNPYPPTPAQTRLEAYRQRRRLQQASLVNNAPIRNVGPSIMSGRVADIAVNPQRPTEFFVAYASGGLWYTQDNGISFRPIFDTTATLTLGAIAVNWKTGQLWAGTGEVNSSRSSYAGMGIYTSADTGRTWQYRGLPESHHIGRIVLHPTNPDVAWVAVMGHLYSSNRERGVYMTTNGGASWSQTLYVDENTGAVDIRISPENPNILWASTWTRSRRAWNFQESGIGSAIWRSDDGGNTWSRLSTDGSGFPTGAFVGRIGLSVYDANTLYAAVDNQEPIAPPATAEPLITAAKLETMTVEQFLALPPDSLNKWLDENGLPQEHTAKSLFADVKTGTYKPADLARYLGDANDRLINAEVKGAEVYRSNDGGKTWVKTHEVLLDRVYNTYGYYFGMVHVAPYDADRVFTYGVPVIMSEDGGRTWQSIGDDNVHADHHMLWVNPSQPGHLIIGNDGGINITYDFGKHWFHCNTPPVGQFYAVQVDHKQPYNVYGGLQDNGTWRGPSDYKASNGWYSEGKYPYEFISGGDGMQVMVDPRDGTTYTGYQFGNYFRTEPNGKRTYLQPRHKLGELPLRFNWQTPIWLSTHNPDILYLGANKVYRSLDRGDTWQCISPDLTTNPQQGDVPYGTLACLTESPHAFGVLYAGSDDGKLHVTLDGGVSWKDISNGLPSNLWVSRIEVSPHNPATVFVSLNGYRWDHMDAYLYLSKDYGNSWTRIGTNLPAEPINVVRQDVKNANILYVGTDHGLYLSLDGGTSFVGYANGSFPEVAVHDLKVHPTEPDLVVGTHGRSLYILDLTEIRLLTNDILASDLQIFTTEPVPYNERWGRTWAEWLSPEMPTCTIPFFAGTAGPVTVRINGKVISEITYQAVKGLNYLSLPLALGAYIEKPADKKTKQEAVTVPPSADGKKYLPPGTYNLQIGLGNAEQETQLVIKEPRKREGRSAPSPDKP